MSNRKTKMKINKNGKETTWVKLETKRIVAN